ncbi:MAG: GNAT family N-acetyltransferase [Candidatus Omnitrophota bacterium]|nr:MAG: GNAT family N-acetyltransferase [Candidatus Omnitrophota bacterium]
MKKGEFDVFLKGELVDLVTVTEEMIDNSNWYSWFNDEEVTQNTQHHYFPNTRKKQLQFYKDEIENNKTRLQLGIVDKKNKILVGMITLNLIDYLNQKCEIAGFIGEKKYQNVSYFIEACKLIIKHAFDNLNMNRIYGSTMKKEISQLFCRALGFKEEGIKRSDVYKNGKYYDVYLVGLLREEFYAKTERNTRPDL